MGQAAVKLLMLVAVTAIAWVAAVPAVVALDGPAHWMPAIAGALLCLVPAAGTLVLADLIGSHAPEFRPTVILMGSMVRLVVAGGGVLLLSGVLGWSGAAITRFSAWVVYFYLITLVTESVLLIRMLKATEPPARAS